MRDLMDLLSIFIILSAHPQGWFVPLCFSFLSSEVLTMSARLMLLLWKQTTQERKLPQHLMTTRENKIHICVHSYKSKHWKQEACRECTNQHEVMTQYKTTTHSTNRATGQKFDLRTGVGSASESNSHSSRITSHIFRRWTRVTQIDAIRDRRTVVDGIEYFRTENLMCRRNSTKRPPSRRSNYVRARTLYMK